MRLVICCMDRRASCLSTTGRSVAKCICSSIVMGMSWGPTGGAGQRNHVLHVYELACMAMSSHASTVTSPAGPASSTFKSAGFWLRRATASPDVLPYDKKWSRRTANSPTVKRTQREMHMEISLRCVFAAHLCLEPLHASKVSNVFELCPTPANAPIVAELQILTRATFVCPAPQSTMQTYERLHAVTAAMLTYSQRNS